MISYKGWIKLITLNTRYGQYKATLRGELLFKLKLLYSRKIFAFIEFRIGNDERMKTIVSRSEEETRRFGEAGRPI